MGSSRTLEHRCPQKPQQLTTEQTKRSQCSKIKTGKVLRVDKPEKGTLQWKAGNEGATTTAISYSWCRWCCAILDLVSGVRRRHDGLYCDLCEAGPIGSTEAWNCKAERIKSLIVPTESGSACFNSGITCVVYNVYSQLSDLSRVLPFSIIVDWLSTGPRW